MKIKKTLLITLLSIFSIFIYSKGYSQDFPNQEVSGSSFEKIYISPERVLIYPEGIFYLNEAGDITPAQLLASDASGLYVAEYFQCPGCLRQNSNNICSNPDCPLNGK